LITYLYGLWLSYKQDVLYNFNEPLMFGAGGLCHFSSLPNVILVSSGNFRSSIVSIFSDCELMWEEVFVWFNLAGRLSQLLALVQVALTQCGFVFLLLTPSSYYSYHQIIAAISSKNFNFSCWSSIISCFMLRLLFCNIYV